MSDFNPEQFCNIETVDGVQYVTIDPHIMYPAVIERIHTVIQEELAPTELIQQRINEAGEVVVSTDRMKTLLNNAKSLPPSAWEDARSHRNAFDSPVGYAPPRHRPPRDTFSSEAQGRIERIWQRGDALEVALGWFLQALRCKIGGSNNTILSGALDGETPQDYYYYQL